MNTPRLSIIRQALILSVLMLPLPLAALAVFENPLVSIELPQIIQNIIFWLLGLAGFLGLLALVVGGIRLIIGGLGSEAEVAQAKRIILWAIIGLIVVGMAAVILALVGGVLGLGVAQPPVP
jgi:hypothetical protein